MALDETDLTHLRRCVEIAREALDAGDEPFGSVLVAGDGRVLAEDRNRVVTAGDETRHPEFDLVRWANAHLDAEARGAATVYTSGEHCPMCSAAHAWSGLGRIVFAVAADRLASWRGGWGDPEPPVRVLRVVDLAPGIKVDGPATELETAMRELHRTAFERRHA